MKLTVQPWRWIWIFQLKKRKRNWLSQFESGLCKNLIRYGAFVEREIR